MSRSTTPIQPQTSSPDPSPSTPSRLSRSSTSGDVPAFTITPPRRVPTPAFSRPPSSHSPLGDSRYPATSLVTPSTPPKQIARTFRPSTPSTLARAINTSLPSTPQLERSSFYSPPRANSRLDEVELTTLRNRQPTESPFHDRHSILNQGGQEEEILQEDPFEYHSTAQRQKTMSGYQFASLSPTSRSRWERAEQMKAEVLDYGDGEVLNEVRPISEARRSLYRSVVIPHSTLEEHPDLSIPQTIPRTTRRRQDVEPIRPTFRGMFVLTTSRDVIFYILPALLAAIGASLGPPYMSMVVGEAFQIFSQYPIDLSSVTAAQRQALSSGVKETSVKLTIAGVASILLNYLKTALWVRQGERAVSRLREKVYLGVQEKGMEWFDMGMGVNEEVAGGQKGEAVGAGGLMAKFTRETDDVRLAMGREFGMAVQNLFTFAFCFALALWKAPVLALVTLSTIPLVALVQIITQVLYTPCSATERRACAEASTNVERATGAISTVKAHNAQAQEVQRFDNIVARARDALVTQGLIWAGSYAISESLLLTTFVVGFWYGAKVVRDGTASVGNVMTVFWAALLAATFLQLLIPSLTIITRGKVGMASLLTVIKNPPGRPISAHYLSPLSSPREAKSSSMQNKKRARPTSTALRRIRPARCHGEINFRSVSFAYPSRPENPVLQDVTLFLPPAETTFIVGGSGSGKSTVAQLLLRLYDPGSGEISLDDQTFSFLDEDFTRQHVAAVQQGCILFDMSIHDNVAMGRAGAGPNAKTGQIRRPVDVTRMEVEEACKMAMIHDFISGLPEGYNTKLGTGGSALSGGQRQRLAIARARIRDPTILVLDEATSALDATSRVKVFEAIKTWRRNRTTIVITHDLSQIQPDDFVYVMTSGRVAEQGFRSDLMGKSPVNGHELGVFASMAAEQAIEPLAPKVEEVKTYEESIMEVLGDDGSDPSRASFLGLPHRPVSRNSFTSNLRPASVAYLGLLDDYSTTEKRVSTRPLSVAQKRLSWMPDDLRKEGMSQYVPEKRASRPGSRMSYARTSIDDSPRYSFRRPSVESFQLPGEKESRPISTLTYTHRRDATLSQNLDAELKGDLDIIIDSKASEAMEPTTKPARKIDSVFKLLLNYLPGTPSKYLIASGIFGAVAHGACTPLWANYLSQLMQIVGQGGTSPSLTRTACIVFALSLGQGFADFTQDYSFYTVASRWIYKIRTKTYTAVLGQSKSFFDESVNSPSNLVQTLIKDADDMKGLVGQVIGKFVTFVVMVGMGIIWALIVQWRLTLIGLSVAPVLGGVVVLNETLIGRAEVRNKRRREAVAKTFYDSFANIRGIRAMALDSTFHQQFQKDAEDALRVGRRDAWIVGIGAGLSAGLVLLVQAMMNWAGMELILRGYMNYVQMLQVYNLVLFSLTFATQLLDFLPQMTKSKVAASDFNRLYTLGKTTDESSGELRFPITGNITFSNVSFTYPTRPDVQIFSNLSFSLRPGECVAIVGPSGSGKSTIAALLQRLYEPSSGVIHFDSHPLSTADVKWLRNHLAIVSQSANLFDATVAENIAYGSEVPIGEVHRAARAANIHEFIMSLPEGYDTNLGENASLISGGQAQRLQIARALVRRGNILILDEATSALDVDNARAILDTVVKIKDSRTTIFITHSMEAMRRCDRIICLGEGRVQEEGSFEDLVARGGVFAQLMRTGEWE